MINLFDVINDLLKDLSIDFDDLESIDMSKTDSGKDILNIGYLLNNKEIAILEESSNFENFKDMNDYIDIEHHRYSIVLSIYKED